MTSLHLFKHFIPELFVPFGVTHETVPHFTVIPAFGMYVGLQIYL